ncbi:MAG: carbamoyltransferase HypF [Anaerolineales bacterium]
MSDARRIEITGVVQGVGFRPWVYRMAMTHDLRGWVRNTSAGVTIHAEGPSAALAAFMADLRAAPPPQAHIHTFDAHVVAPEGATTFEILHSTPIPGAMQPISPDLALCDDCRRELYDPADRRYRYPFINCTQCGPRFTIIQDIPYDRPQTTMAAFDMCAACAAEYQAPLDRRFHAQPVACPVCGPQIWLEAGGASLAGEAALAAAAERLRAGAILAVRGLGGFHLACDATSAEAVARLRARKARPAKPFAVMVRDLATAQRFCHLNEVEMSLLRSPASPIVLLARRADGEPLPEAVAPGQTTLGVMLPYTPLHDLLLDALACPLVMTSGNRVSEPIETENDGARAALGAIADAFLLHDRPIHIRTDDSVMRVFQGAELPLRRSRGYAPYPLDLPMELPPLLAVGAEMKNTFCLARARYAFMSHHIGDLESYAARASFAAGVAHFERLFRVVPTVLAHDLHPDYAATRYATDRAARDDLPLVGVQHHHAHIAACLAEHGHSGARPVLGVCFDGTGYGTDGTIWGGEFLLADYADFQRLAHLKPLPLPGGDAAVRRPYRIAAAYCLACGLDVPEELPLSPQEAAILAQQLARGVNTPLTSSMGRLFDAVSALLGVCTATSYEGQAAILLEARADPQAEGAYAFKSTAQGYDPAPVLAGLLADLRVGVPVPTLAGRFHNSVARLIVTVCADLARAAGVQEVALSGGVFQNVTLLAKTLPLLEQAGLTALVHRRVPPNDGGLALGQAMIAGWRWRVNTRA